MFLGQKNIKLFVSQMSSKCEMKFSKFHFAFKLLNVFYSVSVIKVFDKQQNKSNIKIWLMKWSESLAYLKFVFDIFYLKFFSHFIFISHIS